MSTHCYDAAMLLPCLLFNTKENCPMQLKSVHDNSPRPDMAEASKTAAKDGCQGKAIAHRHKHASQHNKYKHTQNHTASAHMIQRTRIESN
jgi:hypothetical protein